MLQLLPILLQVYENETSGDYTRVDYNPMRDALPDELMVVFECHVKPEATAELDAHVSRRAAQVRRARHCALAVLQFARGGSRSCLPSGSNRLWVLDAAGQQSAHHQHCCSCPPPPAQAVYLDLLEEAEASLLGKATTGCMFHDPAGKHVVDRTKHTGSNPFTGEGCSDKWRRYKLMRGWMCACVLGMCLLLGVLP